MTTTVAVAGIVLGVALGTAALAEPPARRGMGKLYDAKTVETVHGRVEGVEKIWWGKGRGYGIRADVATDAGRVPVHLGPAWYLERHTSRSPRAMPSR